MHFVKFATVKEYGGCEAGRLFFSPRFLSAIKRKIWMIWKEDLLFPGSPSHDQEFIALHFISSKLAVIFCEDFIFCLDDNTDEPSLRHQRITEPRTDISSFVSLTPPGYTGFRETEKFYLKSMQKIQEKYGVPLKLTASSVYSPEELGECK